jgi:cell division protein FtsW
MIHLASALSKVRDFRKDYNLILPSLSMIVLALAVLMAQPNYSRFLVLATVSGLLIFLAGFPLRWGAWLAAGALGLASFLLMQGGYRVHRVMSWLATFMDPLKADFQMLHSYIAIGRGGILGQGAGESIQKLILPEPFNDFVFSIFCEEYGLVGSLLLVALYALVFIRGAKIVRRAPDEFGRLLAAGILGLLTSHTLINLMVTTGLIPTTGQPLPLFSYGGTAMLTMLAALGILLNISYQSRSLNPGGRL